MIDKKNKEEVIEIDSAYRKRGMITEHDILEYENEEYEGLVKLLTNKEAWLRTVAVRVLNRKINIHNNETLVSLLLDHLMNEKALYTRLEICNVLEQGDCEVARQMTRYLGRIGHNQHKELPSEVSKKKSYPLPRDLIARTLGNMSPSILPELLDVLTKKDEEKISECVDAIGFLVFYQKELATLEHAEYIYQCMVNYKDNQIIYWKCIECLSAFPYKKTIDLLESIIKNTASASLLHKEAERSLALIERRMGHD